MDHVLIIDDDAAVQEMLSSLLQTQGFQVTSASTSEQALKLLKQSTFSTIVVDIFLPGLNGLEFIEKIQRNNIYTPIIIITGSSQFEIARQAIHLGVYDYLIKPFKNNQFIQVVHNAIKQNELIEQTIELEKQKEKYQTELENKVNEKIAALKESESKYQSLLEQTLAGVYIEQEDIFKYVNHKFTEIFEISQEEVLNKKGLRDFILPDQKSLFLNHIKKVEKDDTRSDCFRFQVITGKGNIQFLELWSGKVQYNGSSAYEGIILDVTEQHNAQIRERKLELELLNEHKLAAIGQLTAGISHNLNTPISIIQANAELLKMRKMEEPEIDKILSQTKRMEELINTILIKGKNDQSSEFVQIDINDLLRQELEFFNANLYFKHHIEKEYDFEEGLPSINGVYNDFSHSIMNIVQNSVDAMYKRQERKLKISTKYEKNNIVIRISDTGSGIPKEIQPKIFDPFFTTKPVRDNDNMEDIHSPQGTGLGLSLVYNLLKPYNAKIEFSSSEQDGTEFVISIPIEKK